MADCEQLKIDLRNFLQFACEKKFVTGDVVIKSVINVFKKSPSSRLAVLMFFGQLFDDLVERYMDDNHPMRINKSDTSLLWRLFQRPNEPKMITKERKSSESPGGIEGDTPMSPPMMDTGSSEVPMEQDEVNVRETIQKYIDWIGETLMLMVEDPESTFRQPIVDWSLQFISALSTRYPIQNLTQTPTTNPVLIFSDYINFWVKCPVIELIFKIIMTYSLAVPSSATNCQAILKRLIDFSPGSDWISAHLIASLPSHINPSLFSTCIESLLQSQASPNSITNILSYISEHNPQAIINASRSNIPFLLKLSANSKPLLDLLALEAVKQVDIKMLNDLSNNLTENLQPPVIYCIMHAPNSYELLLLIFEACSHPDANDMVREKAFSILSSIVSHLHESVYSTNANTLAPILETLRNNLDHLVTHAITQSSGNLKRLQTRMLQLLCLQFGPDFTSKVLHQILNSLSIPCDGYTLVNPPNPILVNLIKSLKLPFGGQIYKCFEKAVQELIPKNANFWANLLSLVDSDDTIDLDIDILTRKFSDYLQEGNLDHKLFYTIRLIVCCVEKNPKIVARPKHHLSISIMSLYMKILDSLETDDSDMELKMQMVTTAQKLMSSLSKGQIANQHILSRALIESELRGAPQLKGKEFERMPSYISMFKENLQYGNAFKFRKISLNPKRRLMGPDDIEKKSSECSLRRQLLVDAVRYCIIDTQSFASLLVECLTPDVMFNDKPWPDEDFLKVTIERDLQIARKFESNPVLWDFCELIAKANCLHSCSVLLRALLAVQLCRWVSATASKDKLDSTQRLVSLIASSELVPSTPFKYLPEIMSFLTPWEIFCVLNDLWRYLRDNSPPSVRPNQGPLRSYLERLRIIAAQKLPGPLFVKIFKGLE